MFNWKTRECVQEVVALILAVLFLVLAVFAGPARTEDWRPGEIRKQTEARCMMLAVSGAKGLS